MPNYDSGYSSNMYTNSINVDGGRKLNDISRGLNNFALNINKMILNNQREPITENIVLSPMSIAGIYFDYILVKIARKLTIFL